jgi:hypothetical protein
LPEEVLFYFLLAHRSCIQEVIRLLIVDHPDAALLWQGPSPPDVAVRVAEPYPCMVITRVEEGPDRLLLQSSASPVPLTVVKVGGEWRVDAAPLIAYRKRVRRGFSGENRQYFE